MKKLLIIILLLTSLQCFSQKFKVRFTSPAFQKGGWIIPTATLAGATYFGIAAINANKQVTIYDNDAPYTYRNTGKANAYGLYSAALLLATFTVTISMQSDK